MKNLIEEWDFPSKRNNEGRDLNRILDDLENGELIYQGTNLEDLKKYNPNIINLNQENVSSKDLINYFDKVGDYCLGQIILTERYEQIKWFRRSEQIEDLIEELKEVDEKSTQKKPSYPFLSIKFSDN